MSSTARVIGIVLIVLGLVIFLVGLAISGIFSSGDSRTEPLTNTQWWLLFIGVMLPIIGLVFLVVADVDADERPVIRDD